MVCRRLMVFSGLVLIVALGAPASGAPASAPADVEAFMRGFRSLKGFEAKFVETKTMSLLAIPLVTEGRLFFAPPGRLLRQVDKPQPARVLVTPKEVTMRAAGQTQRLDLAARPEVRSLVSSLLSLMSGDLAALRATYEVAYTTGSDGWRLDLAPRSKRVAALVKGMRFEGAGQVVKRITIEEASGDRATTEIVEAHPNRRFSAAELRRLFEAP